MRVTMTPTVAPPIGTVWDALSNDGWDQPVGSGLAVTMDRLGTWRNCNGVGAIRLIASPVPTAHSSSKLSRSSPPHLLG